MGVIGNVASTHSASGADDVPPFIRKVSTDLFTCEPDGVRAAELEKVVRQFWQYNAEGALLTASHGLGESLDRLLSRVRSIDLNRRLAPRLSARLAGLMEAMERRDGYAVVDALQAWCADPQDDWYADSLVTESIAVHAWETSLLREIRLTRISEVAPLQFFPLLERDVAPLHAAVLEALDRIRQVDPAMHSEINAHVSLIKLFTGSGIEGLSSPKAFGALWLKAPAPEAAQAWFLEHLVHECSHLHLNALLVVDPLMTNPQEVNQAPIRPDPRPMFQILHGTFVLARNCRVHERLDKQFPDLNLRPGLEKFREQFLRGVEVLDRHMQPTPRGRMLLDSLKASVTE